MNDSATPPDQPRAKRFQEYEDPQYHDDDLEVSHDEPPPKPTPEDARRQAMKKLNARKRHEE